MQLPPGKVLVEQLGKLLGHDAGKLLRVGDGDGAAVVARDVMADADGEQLDRRIASRSLRSPGADGAPDMTRS